MIQIEANTFISAGGDGYLVAWQLNDADGKLIAQLPEPIFCLAYQASSGRCAAGTRLGNVYELNIQTKALIRQWKAHPSAIFQLHYEEEGSLLSLSQDGVIKRWADKSTQLIAQNKIADKSLRALKTDHNENYIIGASDGVLRKVKADNLQVESAIQVFSQSIFALDKVGEELFCAGRNAQIVRVQDGQLSDPINAHWFTIHALTANETGKYLASGSMDKTIKIWNRENMELLKVIDRERYGLHSSSVNAILWVAESKFLSASDDRMIAYFEIG